MKKQRHLYLTYLNVTLIMVMLLNGSICAQNHVEKIRLNFQTRRFENLDKLSKIRYGEYYEVEIYNINTNLYKISINKSDSTKSKALAIPTFASFGLESLEKLIAGLSPVAGITAPALTNLKNVEKKALISESFELQMNESPEFEDSIKTFLDSLPGSKPQPTPEELAKTLIDGYQQVLKTQVLSLEAFKDRLDQLQSEHNRFLLSARIENTDNNFGVQQNINLVNLYNVLTDLRSDIIELTTENRDQYQYYVSKASEFEQVIARNSNLKKADEEVRFSYKELDSLATKAKESVSSEQSNIYIASLITALNNSCEQYKSLPFQFTKEQATLSIDIHARDEKSMLQGYSTKLSFPVDDKQSLLGVSTGFFLSFLANNAFSIVSNYDSVMDTTTYSLVKEDPGNFEFGINAIVRKGWRIKHSKTFFQVGLGPAVAIGDKIKPRLLAGLGLAHGEKHKLLFDFGAIAGNVDVLSKGLAEDREYAGRPDRVVVSRMKAGLYFSIGYLFTD